MDGSVIRADAEIRARLERVAPGADECDALLARVMWCRLVEPGDGLAGALLAALGPVAALDALLLRRDVARVSAELREHGFEIEPRRLTAAYGRWWSRIDRAATCRDLDTAIANGMRLLTPEDPAWPDGFADLGVHAPMLLWVFGDAAALAHPSLAVVGARACTGYGSQVTAELVEAACASGLAIVSGGAYGVDAVAHRTALALESPTIAIVAGGIDRPYPASHASLFASIGLRGCICSEVVPGTSPTRWRFLQRNRLIAALSLGTLVTEAGVRSGSLNTAGHAAELSRPLGAVPGPVTSPASAGCHSLIREYGAALVTGGGDLREMLGIGPDAVDAPGNDRQPFLHQRILDSLPLRGSRSLVEICRASGVGPDEAVPALAELELLGSVLRRETLDGFEARWQLQR